MHPETVLVSTGAGAAWPRHALFVGLLETAVHAGGTRPIHAYAAFLLSGEAGDRYGRCTPKSIYPIMNGGEIRAHSFGFSISRRRRRALELDAKLKQARLALCRVNPEELCLRTPGISPWRRAATQDVLWVRPHERCILPSRFHVPPDGGTSNPTYQVRSTPLGDVISGLRRIAARSPRHRINATSSMYSQCSRARARAQRRVWLEANSAADSMARPRRRFRRSKSKFSSMRSSKVARVHMAARLKAAAIRCSTAQFPNPHLDQFGATVVPEERFQGCWRRRFARRDSTTQRALLLAGAPRRQRDRRIGSWAAVGRHAPFRRSRLVGPAMITQTS